MEDNMTSEIIIMNKEAIALATDSAVTVGQGGEQKVFTSANKLFTLSKYHPIGIMVFGSARFMEIPWEIIIKIYRNKLNKQKLNTLKEYATNFITFLSNSNPLFPEDLQKNFFHASIAGYFENQIKKDINEEAKSILNRGKGITDTQVEKITADIIKKHYGELENIKMLPSIPKIHIKGIIKKYYDIINKVIEDIFEELPISNSSLKQLREISAGLFSKDIFPAHVSGVVIAGFGGKEPFPSFKTFIIEGIVNNKLKYREDLSSEISFKNTAEIIALAQREMVHTFMEGIDPYLQQYMENGLSNIFQKYPKIIVENIKKLNNNEKQMLLKKLKKASNTIVEKYHNNVMNYKRNNYVEPVMTVISMLPKNEIAVMAESLVSLTSFKRKITLEAETVAGPIDIAVISKGDGFIWIKRKHYFQPELNPQFFANYYKEL